MYIGLSYLIYSACKNESFAFHYLRAFSRFAQWDLCQNFRGKFVTIFTTIPSSVTFCCTTCITRCRTRLRWAFVNTTWNQRCSAGCTIFQVFRMVYNKIADFIFYLASLKKLQLYFSTSSRNTQVATLFSRYTVPNVCDLSPPYHEAVSYSQ